MTDWEHKTLPLVQLKVDDGGDGGANGSFGGYASVFNKVDSYGDTVVPGAYEETIPKFVKEGFISWSHMWDTPIATVKSAEEDHHGLYIEGEFHSTDEAQRARRIASERIDRNKTMGLSIGFMPKEVEWPDEGDDWWRKLVKVDLFETSMVLMPADKFAQVDEAKAVNSDKEFVAQVGDASDFVQGSLRRIHVVADNKSYYVISGRLKGTNLIEKQAYRYPYTQWTQDEAQQHAHREAGTDLTTTRKQKFADHLNRVLGEVTEVAQRAENLRNLRVKEGRTLSSATREKLESITEHLEACLSTTKGLLTTSVDVPDTEDPNGDKSDSVPAVTEVQRELLRARRTLADVTLTLAN